MLQQNTVRLQQNLNRFQMSNENKAFAPRELVCQPHFVEMEPYMRHSEKAFRSSRFPGDSPVKDPEFQAFLRLCLTQLNCTALPGGSADPILSLNPS